MEAYVVSAGMGDDYTIYGVYSTLQGAKNRIESLKRVKHNIKNKANNTYLFSDYIYTSKFLSNFNLYKSDIISANLCDSSEDIITYEFRPILNLNNVYAYINKVTIDEDIEQ